MDSFSVAGSGNTHSKKTVTPSSDNASSAGKTSSWVDVREVKPVTTSADPAASGDVDVRQTSSQPLVSYSVAPARKVDPIPLLELKHTLGQLKSLPMAMHGQWSDADIANFESRLGVFESRVAPDLQRALEYDAATEAGWFGHYWDEMYLKSRVATPINVSFGLELNSNNTSEALTGQQTVLRNMAGAVLTTYEHLQIIQEGKLAVERDARGKPLCMNQSNRLFCHRKAMPDKDELVPCPQGKAQHIIALAKGQIYRVSISDALGKRVSQAELTKVLANLSEAKLGEKNARNGALDLTAMTAVDRDQCAALQAQFVAGSENNKVLIEQVEQAFCCVCLDDCEGVQEEGVGKQLLAGNGSNRCFDKSLQLIRLANGAIGATLEHAPADAGAWFPLFDKIKATLAGEQQLHGELVPDYTLLTPEIDDDLRANLTQASEQYLAALDQVDLQQVHVKDVDQAFLRRCGISSDAFYQLAFQLAAHHAGYKHPPTYESASMREYRYGRTDDLRSYSAEVMNFLAAVNIDDVSDGAKADLLMKALKAHKEKIKACKTGHGICRHLFALEKKWEELHPKAGKPALFTDPVYLDLVKKSTLTTSCVANPNISRFVFGPPESDGLGIAYYPTSNELRVSVSWQNNNQQRAQQFVRALEPSAQQLFRMLCPAKK